MDDWIAGKIPKNDNLLVGKTPDLYQQIGLSALPMTIDQTHVDYAINGTKNEEHHMGAEMLKKLPELIADPVAIIESETRPDDSVVAIVSGEVMGRQVMAAVEIGGIGRMNGKIFDANVISSVYGRKNAVTKLLTNALQKQNADKAGVYYLKKSEARSLYARAGVQFPGSAVQDGLNHSIFDAGASVNKKFLDQTETKQFRRWFGKSAVVDSAGKPLVMYHGTRPENGNFTVFDYDRAVKKGGLGLQALGKGNYFTAKKLTGTERYGSRIIQAYLSIQNPYRFYGGQSLAEKLAAEMKVDQTTLNGAGFPPHRFSGGLHQTQGVSRA